MLSTVVRITHICTLELSYFHNLSMKHGSIVVKIRQKVTTLKQVTQYYNNMDVKAVTQLEQIRYLLDLVLILED